MSSGLSTRRTFVLGPGEAPPGVFRVHLDTAQRELDAARATLEGDGVEALARATDVARFTDVKALVDEVEARWGRVDVLVNNAGVNGAIGRLDESDTAEWKLAFEVNVFGTMHACRAVLPGMRARRRGKMVKLAANRLEIVPGRGSARKGEFRKNAQLGLEFGRGSTRRRDAEAERSDFLRALSKRRSANRSVADHGYLEKV